MRMVAFIYEGKSCLACRISKIGSNDASYYNMLMEIVSKYNVISVKRAKCLTMHLDEAPLQEMGKVNCSDYNCLLNHL